MILAPLLCALTLAQPGADAPKQQLRHFPTGKYTIVKISGDIDSDLFVRSITGELDRARSDALIILELDGNRARPDLIARLGTRLANNSPPVAVYLKDSMDKRVGVGQALLGGFVKNCFIDPDTRITSSPQDDLRYLAPLDTNWESIEQELTGPLWRRLTGESADQTLPPLLVDPARDTWAVPVKSGEPWRLSTTAPAGGQSGPPPRQVCWSEGGRLDIDAESAIGLRLCAGEARGMAPILMASILSPRSSGSKRSIESKFPDAAATIPRILDDAKLALRRTATALTIKSTDHIPTPDDFRRAGQSALTQIDATSRELDRAEELLADFPELNRRRGLEKPTRTDKGPWRPTIDTLRKDLDKHRTTARDFASR